jgi:hypothetical protein
MLPYQMIAGGKFSLTTANISSGLDLVCQSQDPPDFILLKSITGWGEASDAQAIEWWWERSMAQGSAKGILQSSEGSTPQLPAMTSYTISSNGITTYDTANPPSFTALATTAITGSAGTFVVSMASTGSIAVGDYVRLYSTTGELQIAGYTFQVTAVTANVSITLGYMASAVSAGGLAAFAADATAGFVEKFIPNRMYPRYRYVAMITKATEAVVYFTEKNDFTPGEIVSFRVPSEFGMEEINNLPARVLSVTNSSTVSSITIDLDTSGFTTFVFPTSAVADAGVSPAVCVPSSSGVVPYNGSATVPQEPPGTNLQDAFDNRNVRVIHLGSGLFNVSAHTSDAEDVWMWQAYKYDSYQAF